MESAFAKLKSESICVQSAEDCPEDAVVGLDCVCEDEDAINVDGNPIDPLQSSVDVALEGAVQPPIGQCILDLLLRPAFLHVRSPTCQFMGHAYVLA